MYKKSDNPDFKVCLTDANDNIYKSYNINQDRNAVLQTDDTMVDFYNIENDIDNIKLSAKRNKMINEDIAPATPSPVEPESATAFK